MIKISLGTKFAGVSFSSALAMMVFGCMVYLTSPEIKPPANPSSIDFSTLPLPLGPQKAFAASSPFGNVLPQNAMDNAPVQAPTYIPGSPMVPQMPDTPGAPARQSEVLSVIGVLPPDVVILKKGGQTITAKTGSKTDFGTIGTISKTGATVDGNWIEFSR